MIVNSLRGSAKGAHHTSPAQRAGENGTNDRKALKARFNSIATGGVSHSDACPFARAEPAGQTPCRQVSQTKPTATAQKLRCDCVFGRIPTCKGRAALISTRLQPGVEC